MTSISKNVYIDELGYIVNEYNTCPYLNHINEISLKFIALVCLKSLAPMYFIV